jgi:hypothetical protein
LFPLRAIAVSAAVAAAALISALPAVASLRPATGFHSPVRAAVRIAELPGPVPSVTGDLTLSVSKTKIAYHKSVTVTAHLGSNTGENPVVSIFRIPAGGSPVLVATGAVDVNGNFKATVTLTRTSSFTAHWDGDGTLDPTDSAPRTVGVHVAMVSAWVSRPYSRAGAYRLFHFHSSCVSSGKGCVVWAAKVKPNHAGESVTFVLQRKRSGRWSAVGSLPVKLNSESTAAVRFRYAKSLIGTNFRFVARFAGDSTNLGGSTKFAYFRITK